MAVVGKAINLTAQQGNWITAKTKKGSYADDSEPVLDLIRRKQDRSAEIEAVRGAFIYGEESGKPKRFDAAAFKKRMMASDG